MHPAGLSPRHPRNQGTCRGRRDPPAADAIPAPRVETKHARDIGRPNDGGLPTNADPDHRPPEPEVAGSNPAGNGILDIK